jgi:Zn ribbon nucleic-acid-binding protein
MRVYHNFDNWLTTDPDLEGVHCPECHSINKPDADECFACGFESPQPDYEDDKFFKEHSYDHYH